MLDEPSAEQRAKGGSNRREAGPCTNRFAAGVFVEAGANYCKATGNQQCRADPLHAARDNQLVNAGGETTSYRGCCKYSHSDEKHPSASKQVSEGTAGENQRRQENSIGLDYPLHIDHARVKCCL